MPEWEYIDQDITMKELDAIKKQLEADSLTVLKLSNKKLLNIHAIQIAEVLKHNKNLKILDLDANLIGDEGGIAILKAITVHPSLTILTLNSTGISDAILQPMINMLANNKSLRYLSFFSNDAITRNRATEFFTNIPADSNLRGIHLPKFSNYRNWYLGHDIFPRAKLCCIAGLSPKLRIGPFKKLLSANISENNIFLPVETTADPAWKKYCKSKQYNMSQKETPLWQTIKMLQRQTIGITNTTLIKP